MAMNVQPGYEPREGIQNQELVPGAMKLYAKYKPNETKEK